MDHAPTTLFDLPAAVADEAVEAPEQPPTRALALLTEIRERRAAIVEQEIATVRAIASWAVEHVVTDDAEVCTLSERGLDTGLPIAGPGAPLISDFAVMQISAVLGRTLDSGRSYVGQVVELAHRLPKLWDRVLDGAVPVWKALRVADSTRMLPMDAASFVDRQLALIAHGMTWSQVDRLVEEALVRFDPQAAEERRKTSQDQRRFDIDLHHAGFDGVAHVSGTLDVADAMDLEAAIARRAELLGKLGSDEPLDVRRSSAAGELARQDLTLDLEIVDEDTGEISVIAPGRKVELVVHINPTTLEATPGATADGDAVGAVARLSNTRSPISPEQVREWIARPGASVIVRPVLDLNGHQPTGAYEIPDRIRRPVNLRDHHCVFPHCTRPVQRCDLDHVRPHSKGGPTCPCNLAPLCRGHHRLKTAGLMTYRMLTPGTYHWAGPAGTWLVDPTGTHDLTIPAPDPPDQ